MRTPEGPWRLEVGSFGALRSRCWFLIWEIPAFMIEFQWEDFCFSLLSKKLGHTSACFPAEGTKTIIPGLQAIYQNLTGSMSSWNIHLGWPIACLRPRQRLLSQWCTSKVDGGARGHEAEKTAKFHRHKIDRYEWYDDASEKTVHERASLAGCCVWWKRYESWKQLSSFGWKIATWVWTHYFAAWFDHMTICYDTMLWLYHTTNNYFHNTQGKHGTFHATFWNKVTQRARYDVPPEEFDEVVKASRPLAEADPGWDAENGILTRDTVSFHW